MRKNSSVKTQVLEESFCANGLRRRCLRQGPGKRPLASSCGSEGKTEGHSGICARVEVGREVEEQPQETFLS